MLLFTTVFIGANFARLPSAKYLATSHQRQFLADWVKQQKKKLVASNPSLEDEKAREPHWCIKWIYLSINVASEKLSMAR